MSYRTQNVLNHLRRQFIADVGIAIAVAVAAATLTLWGLR